MAFGLRCRSALLVLAACAGAAEGHGRLTVPRARNVGDNGAVGGGPGAVHAFDGAGGGHSKYQHGVCGNAAGASQSYNKVGESQGRYTAGSLAEFEVVITAHHVGYFEFELCEDAGQLSEACFAKHRLLKEGCECSCPGDSTNSCADCDVCRRWWKPLLEGERSQSVTKGYAGVTLPGKGNLVPYEFTMRYMIPANLKTRRGVLRWHYMTTNSCTSKSSAPEEFWNCADIEVGDDSGDVGADLDFDNAALEGMAVENLLPRIDAGELPGVNSICPEDSEGALLGVGSAEDYEGLCGESSDGVYANCRDMSSGTAGAADCSSPPDSGVLCEHECSDGWFQCHNGVAYTKYVPQGTKCKGNQFVLAAECASFTPQPTSPPTATPSPEHSTAAPATPAPSPAPVETSTTEPVVTTAATTSAMATTAAPTTAASTEAPKAGCATSGCGSCSGCLWSSGVCYTEVDSSYCGMWSDNKWCCADGSVAQQSLGGSQLRGSSSAAVRP